MVATDDRQQTIDGCKVISIAHMTVWCVLLKFGDIRNIKSSNALILVCNTVRRSLHNYFIYNEWHFLWNIVTLPITEGKFINSPFILCLEQHFSWKKSIIQIFASFWEDKCKKRCNQKSYMKDNYGERKKYHGF